MRRWSFCFIVMLLLACNKIQESAIPYAQVYLNIDLRYQDKDLVGIYNHKTITSARTAGERTGFAGVLVVCGIDAYGNMTYYAFDACCPHEAKRNITIEADNTGRATCPQCGTVFDIGYGTGTPVEGISHYALRRYNVTPKSSSGQEYVITY